MKQNAPQWRTVIFLACISWSPIHAIDNPHFYRALVSLDGPRFETRGLGSYETRIGAGATRKGRNQYGQRVPLLDIYGAHRLTQLAAAVPNLNPDNPIDQLLIAAEELPTTGTFGQISYRGRFQLMEMIFQGYQNVRRGFFGRFYIPVRYLHIDRITYTDLSPAQGIYSKQNATWQALLAALPQIYARYNIQPIPPGRAGLGDTTLLVGWATSHQKTNFLDFVDVAAQWGGLFPTGKRTNPIYPFDIPTGYNGFWGMPIIFDVSMGIWEWFTAALHIDGLFLFKQTHRTRLKTSDTQSGMIYLYQQPVSINPGTLWNIGGFIQADHFSRGLSAKIEYTYTKKDRDCLWLANADIQTLATINQDQRFRSWSMHTFHIAFEYDCSRYTNDGMPRVSLYANWVVAGKRVFNTPLYQGGFGVDCCVSF